MKTTNEYMKYWRERHIDWNTHYTATWNHPHRVLLIAYLHSIPWISLWEIGCGSAPNLVRILKEGFTGKQLGGSDINADAIETAKKTFKGGLFQCESSDDLLMSDESTDIILSDAHLIYVGPTKIGKVLDEMTRVARNFLILCEFHEKSWYKRLFLWWKTGYFAHNFETLLKQRGCYDIRINKIPTELWSGTPWEEAGYFITCRIAHI